MENTEETGKKMKKEDCTLEAEEKKIEEVEEKVNEAKKDEVDYKEKYFYVVAEMDNLRKRLEREKSQIVKFGNESILSDLVQVIDTFELTLKAIRKVEDENVKNIVIGLEMVNKQFLEALQKHGLEKIETTGKTFDPNFHEAIATEKAEDKKEMEILEEQQSGYVLNGRVLRASKVVVSGNK